MAEINYAFIKNNEVVNIVVFDNPSDELLNTFKIDFELDDIKPATGKASVGGTYDGSKFWAKQPFPSWIKNEGTDSWDAPTDKPLFDGDNPKYYAWDEDTLSWIEVVLTE